MREVTIGGERRTLGDFSTYKGFKALEIASEIEETVRELVEEAGEWKRQYEATHYVEMDRAEARRFFPPEPMIETVPYERDGELVRNERGEIVMFRRPLTDPETGQVKLGPDPLGHLTDADWKASGEKLRTPDSPSEAMVIAAMVPRAFKAARQHSLRLVALVLVPSSDLERWDLDNETDVDTKLDEEGQRLLHHSSMVEFTELVAETIEQCREELAGPFGRIATGIQSLRSWSSQASANAADAEPAPMTVEAEESEGEQGSTETSPGTSTLSPAPTAGPSAPSSTPSPGGEPAGSPAS